MSLILAADTAVDAEFDVFGVGLEDELLLETGLILTGLHQLRQLR